MNEGPVTGIFVHNRVSPEDEGLEMKEKLMRIVIVVALALLSLGVLYFTELVLSSGGVECPLI